MTITAYGRTWTAIRCSRCSCRFTDKDDMPIHMARHRATDEKCKAGPVELRPWKEEAAPKPKKPKLRGWRCEEMQRQRSKARYYAMKKKTRKL